MDTEEVRKAERAKARLKNSPTRALREQIADTADASHDKAAWLAVFADDEDMIARFTGGEGR